MAEVDPFDDSIVRYVIERHRYDPETKHFRWFYESAYDNKREFKKQLQEAFDALEIRRVNGNAHIKEELAGVTLEIGHFANAKLRRELRQRQGAYREVSPRTFKLFKKRWL
jgi:hypothetical protein